MSKLWRGVIAMIAAVSVWAGVMPAATTQASATTTSFNVDASAALAISAKTGKIMYAQNADKVLPIASMTKMLGIYLVRDAIQSGKLQWDDTVTPSASIAKLSQDHDLSNVPMTTDGKYTIKELYQASLIYSANAAMMLLGNAVSGSQAKFVDAMRAQLVAWGIKDATIVNVTGLDNNQVDTADRYPKTTTSDQNQMSAKDVAIVAQHLLNDYPDVLDTTKMPSQTFQANTKDATKMDNYNLMLPGLSAADKGLAVDGLKTGTTDRAGDCFTGTAVKNGTRIITVVMHANGNGDSKRFVQTAKLMNWTFANWRTMTVTTAGKPVSGHERLVVRHGVKPYVPLAATKTLQLEVPKATTTADIHYAYTAKLKNKLEAPVQKDATAGTLTVSVNGENLGYLNGRSNEAIALKTTQQVDRKNVFALIFDGVGEWIGSLF
ncbi:serine hydrolase [Lacticaseibacillus sp. GG6-2]